ncbi:MULTISPECIES: TetR/AcrR family transcriptional regulator [Rhodococcus]|uniref:TetR family transcriptional regulator n=2 Tax=Rhodococcus TaxID=1827 RepID=M2ZAN0_9NOCA|nr:MULTISPECIES: TetR family transcriptional regulator [Rhodococcus]EME64412.1 TetR family transcriptional regulator [Rhodococcus ruber BKS 20-38]MDM7489879.1 TetR family transcriptional regulator [Rhodococcus indonesiensis]
MTDKRAAVLDAAIELLGREGLRGLTHRGVDAVAGAPAGSTSNYFRTRRALLEGVLDRLVERDRSDIAALGGGNLPRTEDELVDVLAGYVMFATGPDALRTRARFALFVEATASPSLRRSVQRRRDELQGMGLTVLAALGSADPAGGSRILADHLDGMILHRLTSENADSDPRDDLRRLVRALR